MTDMTKVPWKVVGMVEEFDLSAMFSVGRHAGGITLLNRLKYGKTPIPSYQMLIKLIF